MSRLPARRWESEVLLSQSRISAGLIGGFVVCELLGRQAEDVVVLHQEGVGVDGFLGVLEGADDGVVDEGAFEVVVRGVFGVEHGGGDVWSEVSIATFGIFEVWLRMVVQGTYRPA